MIRLSSPLPLIASSLLLLLGSAPDGHAQEQARGQRNCIVTMNRDLGSVARFQARTASRCIRDEARGVLTVPVETCLTSDPLGLVARAEARTFSDAAARCSDVPDFGFSGPASVNQAGIDQELGLVHDLYGPDLDAGALFAGTQAVRCQQNVTKAAQRCKRTILNTFRSCKQTGLRTGSIVDASGLEACFGADPRGRIERLCETVLTRHVERCSASPVELSSLFPGSCASDDPVEFAACLDAAATCRACLAINEADRLNADCDSFDDGIDNDSCGVKTLGQTVGVNTHYGSYGPVNHGSLARLAEAGVSFIRNDLTWAAVEQEAGVYDFVGSGYDELVEACEALGLRILFILDYGNPLYGENQEIVDEQGRQAFAAFAAAAASRYGGRGHSWEIWNEPNREPLWSSSPDDPELYAGLIRTTVPALRAADPEGEIVVGALIFGVLAEILEALGLGLSGPHFLETVAATGVLSLVDEVTIHLHRAAAPESAAADIQDARDVLNGAGVPLPVSSGEWGYSTYDPNVPPTGINYLPAVTLNRQASYVARMLLLNFSLDLRRSVIFKDLDGQEPGNLEHHFGLMLPDLSAKPSYLAVSTLTELLGDAGPPETLSLGAGEHGLRFRRPDGSQVTALWAEQTATWLLRSEGPGDAHVLGRDGAELTPAGLSDGALLTLESDDGPIYLIGNIAVASVE